MVIDFHTHAFPDALSQKALSVLSKSSGNMLPVTDGTVRGLLAAMDKSGVDKAVVLGIATNPKQQHNVNNFAAAINSERLIAFGSVHPDAPDAIEELHRLAEMGLRGVKFHPEYQDFFVDEERMLPIYETCDRLGLIVSFHAGLDVGYPEPAHNPPERMSRILSAFPKGRVVAAHFGGYARWPEVLEHLAGKNLYIDTSFCYSRVPCPIASEIVRVHGADKILFGSDLPWSDEKNELSLLDALDISEADKEAIRGKNAVRLLGL